MPAIFARTTGAIATPVLVATCLHVYDMRQRGRTITYSVVATICFIIQDIFLDSEAIVICSCFIGSDPNNSQMCCRIPGTTVSAALATICWNSYDYWCFVGDYLHESPDVCPDGTIRCERCIGYYLITCSPFLSRLWQPP